MHDQMPTDQLRNDLLQAKQNAFGILEQDSGSELSDEAFYQLEIKETRSKRNQIVRPLAGIGTMISFLSFAGETQLTSIISLLIGLLMILGGVALWFQYQRRLHYLNEQLTSCLK